MGPSGSGKSTLMHCVAGLDTLTSGQVFIGETDLSSLNDRQLTQLRRERVGFIFQAFNLVPTLTAIENITLPLTLAGRKPDREWLESVVETVGLGSRLRHRPSELSGGQQQRVAVARALASRPEIIFADEPTGNLDSQTGAEILSFMRRAVREMGQTIVMVTHDPVAAAYADRALFLADGRIVDDMANPDRRPRPRPNQATRPTPHEQRDQELITMLHLTLRELAAKKLRLLTTAIAVMLGVAFMAGTLVLTATISKTFDGLFADGYAGTDAYVRGTSEIDAEFGAQRPRLDASIIDTIKQVDGVAAAEGKVSGYAQLVDDSGEPVGDPGQGAPTFGESWSTVTELNPYRIAEGRAPSRPDEVVIDRHSAKTGNIHVGDATTVLTKRGAQQFTVSGIATFGDADSMGGASAVLFEPTTAQDLVAEPGQIDGVAVVAADGVSQQQVNDSIAKVLPAGAEVLTGDQITAETQGDVKDGMAFFNTFLMVFAVIALFVGAFIIFNTFSIIVAQRQKEMALLRALGASNRQVTRSVLVEATIVGFIASLAGVGAGIGVAKLLKMLLAAFGIDIPAGSVVVALSTVVTCLAVGTIVTVASALVPARRAGRVPPVAAMREVAVDRTASSRRRVVIGGVILAAGVGSLVAGLSGGAIVLVGVGALVTFVAVAFLAPVLARPVARVIGAPMARLGGVSGTLGRENAMRTPKRTASTAAALMIGVGLVGFIMTFAASAKASINGVHRP